MAENKHGYVPAEDHQVTIQLTRDQLVMATLAINFVMAGLVGELTIALVTREELVDFLSRRLLHEKENHDIPSNTDMSNDLLKKLVTALEVMPHYGCGEAHRQAINIHELG